MKEPSIDANKENSDSMWKKHCDKCNMHILQCQANFIRNLQRIWILTTKKIHKSFLSTFPLMQYKSFTMI